MAHIKFNNKAADLIEPEKSLELVKTLLSMSVGCITYLRGLFEEDCYKDELFYPDLGPRHEQTDVIRVKLLERNRNVKSDILMSWLYQSIFPLIEKKHLQSVSFFLFQETDSDTKILEAFKFDFSYHHTDFVQGNKSNKDESRLGDISLAESRKSFERFLRKLILVTQLLPPLPPRRGLSVRLMVNENCPTNFQSSPGLKEVSADPQPVVTVDKIEVKDQTSAAEFVSSYHTIVMKLLKNVDPDWKKDNCTMVDVFGSALTYPTSESPLSISSLVLPKYVPSLKFHFADQAQQLQEELATHKESSQVEEDLTTFIQNRTTNSVSPTQPANRDQDYQMGDLFAKTHWTQNAIHCECSYNVSIPNIGLISCGMCQKAVHRCCYFNNARWAPKGFKCYTCRALEEGERLPSELAILMNIRKIFKVLSKHGVPSTVDMFLYNLGHKEARPPLKVLKKAISVLIRDQILMIDEDISAISPTGLTKSKPKYCNMVTVTDNLLFKKNAQNEYGILFLPLAILKSSYYRGRAFYENVVKERRNFYFQEAATFHSVQKVLDVDEMPVESKQDYSKKVDPITYSSQIY